MIGLCRTEQQRHDKVLARLAREVAEHHRRVRLFVHQQLFQKRVVVVRKLFEHVKAFCRFPIGERRWHFDALGRLAGPVVEGAFEREVDEAGDRLALAYGDLPRKDGFRAHRLQRFEEIADAPTRGLDLVDENRVREAKRFKLAQGGLGERSARGIGVDHYDRKIGGGYGKQRIGRKAGRAGRVHDRECIAEVIEAGEIEFGGAAPRARFRRRIADARSGLHAALPRDRTRREQHRFYKARLARARRADERHHPDRFAGLL